MSFNQFENFKKYLGENMLSVDFGTKVVGLATFTPGRDPFPIAYGRLIRKTDEQIIAEIEKIVQTDAVGHLVLGLPKLLDGKESTMSELVRKFGIKLSTALPDNIKLHLQDETLTSYEAENRMKNSPQYNFKVDPKRIDELSAVIILEDFIRS